MNGSSYSAWEQAQELNYDKAPDYPPLEQDPKDPSHWTYTSPDGVTRHAYAGPQYAPQIGPPVLHQWTTAEPRLKVKLERGQKAGYAWEISFEGSDMDAVLDRITQVDERLRFQFGGGA